MIAFQSYRADDEMPTVMLLTEEQSDAKQLQLVHDLGAVMTGSNACRIRFQLREWTYVFLLNFTPAQES